MVANKISRILVPLDGSDRAFAGLDEAVYIARQCGATITGLCCVPIYPPIPLIGVQSSYRDRIAKEAKKFMVKAKKVCAQNGVEFNDKIIFGVATLDIADFANKKNFDLVVIGHRGHTTAREIFLGSVANALLHKCKMPVLVVK